MNMQEEKRQCPTEVSLRTHFHEIGVEIEAEYIDDVIRNAVVLQEHATTLQAFDPLLEPWLSFDHAG